MEATSAPFSSDWPHDRLFREVVDELQLPLARRGFQVAGRGHSPDDSWIQFSRPGWDAYGRTGELMVLAAHSRRAQTLMMDAYFVDGAFGSQTPRHRLLHRYAPETERCRVVREILGAVTYWLLTQFSDVSASPAPPEVVSSKDWAPPQQRMS